MHYVVSVLLAPFAACAADDVATWSASRTATIVGAHRLEGLRFKDSQDGIAVSNAGSIWQTADGGETWTKSDRDVGSHPMGAHFVEHWTDRVSTRGYLGDVCVVGDQEVWLVGDMLLHSDDGGAEWYALDLPSESDSVASIIASAEGYVWIVNSDDRVFRRRQGDWNQVRFTDVEPIQSVAGVHLPTAQSVYVILTDGSMFASTDSGDTWKRIDRRESFTWPTDPVIHFLDRDNGCVSGKGFSMLWVTSDGGESWTYFPTALDASAEQVTAIQMLDRDTIVACTIEGSVWRIRRRQD